MKKTAIALMLGLFALGCSDSAAKKPAGAPGAPAAVTPHMPAVPHSAPPGGEEKKADAPAEGDKPAADKPAADAPAADAPK